MSHIEIVRLDSLETFGRAFVNPAVEDGSDCLALRVRGSIEQELSLKLWVLNYPGRVPQEQVGVRACLQTVSVMDQIHVGG
jgi:hypothetical protein